MSSSRLSTVAVAKCTSSENICSKPKDQDRNRGNAAGKVSNKRQDFSCSSSSSTYTKQSKKQFSNYSQHRQTRNYRQQSTNPGGRRNQVTQNQRDDFSSLPMDKKGIKKVNLNHLLNFTFENSAEDVSTSLRPFSSRNIPKFRRDHGPVFNKEQFIQANCQVIMKSGRDYSLHLADPDIPKEWDDIEKLNVWNVETPSCPICLYPPLAARITKCAHIYCWPCILHYLALDDRSWRKCPICHEAVHEKDLKSVSVHEDKLYDAQSTITMKLMKRQKGTAVAIPAAAENGSETILVDPVYIDGKEQRNFKYLVATPRQVLDTVVRSDLAQLEFQLSVESDELEKTFIELALKLCRAREVELGREIEIGALQSPALTAADSQMQSAVECTVPEVTSLEVTSGEVTSGDERNGISASSNISENNNARIEDKTENERNAISPDTTSDHVFYFYQATDGQHIYLHPLNHKCLLHQYGGYDRCPPEITARIVQVESYSMDEVTRRRHRHLSHLPLSLELRIVELDMRPPLVSPSTLQRFHEAFDARAAQRKKRARDEKRLLKKQQNLELRKQGKYPAARIRLDSQQQFPQMHHNPASSDGGSFSLLLPSPGTTPGSTNYLAACVDSVQRDEGGRRSVCGSPSSSSWGSGESHVSSTPSFAQMLKTSKSEDDCHQHPTTAWHRRAALLASTSSTMTSSADPAYDDPEDYVAPPTYQSSFGDALSTALAHLDAGARENNGKKAGTRENDGKKAKGGKKGGRKKVLLFSTAGQQHK